MNMAETAGGYRNVLRRYLAMAVYFGPLAVQAGPRPGGDARGEVLPTYLEAIRRRVTHMPGWAVP